MNEEIPKPEKKLTINGNDPDLLSKRRRQRPRMTKAQWQRRGKDLEQIYMEELARKPMEQEA